MHRAKTERVWTVRRATMVRARSQEGRISLNNNRNNNNRRRGRGNRQNQGGGNNQNRIDSRARGNAPQLLDKYKKLAQDAQHNGDRVQAEYYLQFADHYFRVIADNKARQDEARAKRNDDRGQANDDDGENDGDDRRNARRRNEVQNDGRGDDRDDNRNEKRGRGRGRKSRDDDDRQDEASSQDDEGNEAAVEEKPKRRGRKPKVETADADAGEDKPKRRGRKPKPAEPIGGEIDSAVLPPAIGAASGSDEDQREAVG